LKSLGKDVAPSLNILQQIKEDSDRKYLQDVSGNGLLKINVNGSQGGISAAPLNPQPLPKWDSYQDDMFVMGNVAGDNIVYPTRKLLQTSQSVSRYHVQQAEVFL
jgi:hypothetical protein